MVFYHDYWASSISCIIKRLTNTIQNILLLRRKPLHCYRLRRIVKLLQLYSYHQTSVVMYLRLTKTILK